MDKNAETKTNSGANGVSNIALRQRDTDSGSAVGALKPVVSQQAIVGIRPRDLDEVYRLAKGVSASGLAPKGMDKPEQVMVAILTGLELGLPPMFAINKIAVINGRPTLWGDALPALLWGRGFEIDEWMDDTADGDRVAWCKVTRPNGKEVSRSFSQKQAVSMGLWNKQGPWKQMPWRMLQMRARGFACRDGAADVLGGIYITEEIIGAPPLDSAPKTKRKSSYAAKKDGTDEVFNELIAKIRGCKTPNELEALRNIHLDDDGNPWEGMPMRWNDLLEEEYALRADDVGLDVEAVA